MVRFIRSAWPLVQGWLGFENALVLLLYAGFVVLLFL
jgi:hypothetical protein